MSTSLQRARPCTPGTRRCQAAGRGAHALLQRCQAELEGQREGCAHAGSQPPPVCCWWHGLFVSALGYVFKLTLSEFN